MDARKDVNDSRMGFPFMTSHHPMSRDKMPNHEGIRNQTSS